MLELPSDLQRALERCGWFPEWQYNVEGCQRKLLRRYGLQLHDSAREFLSQFGGLAITDRNSTTVYLSPGRIRISHDRRRPPWGDDMFPIGAVGVTVILMDSTGAVYSYWDNELEMLANSPLEALQRFTQSIS